MNQYIVVTPARNEEKMLPDLAVDIANQSIKPLVWIIADDGSIDKTWLIIQELEKQHAWIRGIKLDSKHKKIYAHERNAENVKQAFQYAIEICNRLDGHYNYLAVVDVDVRLENRYFEKIFDAFNLDPRLGVASGFVYEKGLSLKELNDSNKIPRGCAQVFRKECFEIMNGYHGHSLSNVKAMIKNWKVETFQSIKVIHRRPTGIANNYYYSRGTNSYYINYHPINAILTGFYIMREVSVNQGVSYLSGYFSSIIMREQKVADDEIKRYYWNSFHRLLLRLEAKL